MIGAAPRSHCYRRWGRLDPARLSRAVERLLGGTRPEREAGGLSGSFAHLPMAAATAAERYRTAESACWVLGRCLESGRSTSHLLVAYLDPGEHEAGHLLVAGRGPEVADDDACIALSETLLELYRELESR